MQLSGARGVGGNGEAFILARGRWFGKKKETVAFFRMPGVRAERLREVRLCA